MSQDLLDRALGYPYPLPSASYVIDKGEVFPLHANDAPLRREGRTPVLAVGSNQSPEQIARKFPDPSWSEIPMTSIPSFQPTSQPMARSPQRCTPAPARR